MHFTKQVNIHICDYCQSSEVDGYPQYLEVLGTEIALCWNCDSHTEPQDILQKIVKRGLQLTKEKEEQWNRLFR